MNMSAVERYYMDKEGYIVCLIDEEDEGLMFFLSLGCGLTKNPFMAHVFPLPPNAEKSISSTDVVVIMSKAFFLQALVDIGYTFNYFNGLLNKEPSDYEEYLEQKDLKDLRFNSVRRKLLIIIKKELSLRTLSQPL